MWFPSTYEKLPSPFEGVSALDYFVFLLNKLPSVAFSSDSFPALVATSANVGDRCCLKLAMYPDIPHALNT